MQKRGGFITIDHDGAKLIDFNIANGVNIMLNVKRGYVRNIRTGSANTSNNAPHVKQTGGEIDGLIVTSIVGSWSYDNGAANVSGGLLHNFVFDRSWATESVLIMSGGIVSNGLIRGAVPTHARKSELAQNGAMVLGGLLTHCRITQCGSLDTSRNGTVYVSGSAIVRNCLIDNNKSSDIAGLSLNGTAARVENCTFVDNESGNFKSLLDSVGGTTDYGATFTANNNTGNRIINCLFVGAGNMPRAAGVTFTRADDLLAGEGNTTAAQGFKTVEGWPYQLTSGSTLVNAGTTLTWMTGTTDLRGNPRLFGRIVDIGCFERQIGGATLLLR